MPAPFVNQEWLNRNSLRRYPLSEEATARDTTDTFYLPDNFIVDMVLPVHSEMGLDVSRFHVLQIVIFGTGVAVTIGYAGEPVASVTIPVIGFEQNKTFFLPGVGDFTDMSLRLRMMYQAGIDLITVNGEIEDTSGRDRAVSVSFRLPINAL